MSEFTKAIQLNPNYKAAVTKRKDAEKKKAVLGTAITKIDDFLEGKALCLNLADLESTDRLFRQFFTQDVIKRIEKHGITELNLRSNGLTTLPDGITNFIHLEKFDVSKNQLTALPDNTSNLTPRNFAFWQSLQKRKMLDTIQQNRYKKRTYATPHRRKSPQ